MSYVILHRPTSELQRKLNGVFVSRHQGGRLAKFTTKRKAQDAIDKEWGSKRIQRDLRDESALFRILKTV